MKRIFSFLFAIIALVGTTGVFTSCQEDAVEIDYTISVTVNNDLTEVINAINNGNLSNSEGIQALIEAINKLSGDQETKYQALLNAINGLATTLEAKLAVIEAAMKAQALALEGKLDLLAAAIKALPDYSDKLAAIEAAIKALPDYSSKLAAIQAAVEAIPDYTEKLTAIQTALEAIKQQNSDNATAIAALQASIDDIAKAVEEGNKNQEDALAEILALLESISLGGGEDEVTIPYPYVTFTADADQTLSYTGTDLQYSTDGTTFQNLPADTPISFGGKKKLYLRGVNNLDGTDNGDYKGVISFGNDTRVACKGDIRTLIDYATYQTVKTNKAVFAYLFKKCTQLTSAPELPITDVASECYQSMFEHCYALKEAPKLPATTVKVRSYAFMFSGCTSLKEAPALPATNLSDQDRCYAYMFQYCYALEKAPELPATTLGAWGYEYMFEGCRSLTVAPTLPAKTLIIGCYLGMFKGCTKLSSITMLATEGLNKTNVFKGWVDGVAATGTFTKAASATIPEGVDGIPTGWTVVNQ